MGLKKEIKSYLKAHQSPQRYRHILGVKEIAALMGEKYYVKGKGISKKDFIAKLEIAALLHDLDKGRDEEYMLNRINSLNLSKNEKSEIKKNKEIYHAFSASVSAKEKFGVNDEDILSAVRYHTTGKENMSIYDKIIYIADFIEPGRDFPKVSYFRELAFKDLNKCLIESFEYTMEYIKSKGNRINPLTVKARDYLKEEVRKKK